MREVIITTYVCEFCDKRKAFSREAIRRHERWCQCRLCSQRTFLPVSRVSRCEVYGTMWQGSLTGQKRIIRCPPEACWHRNGPKPKDNVTKHIPVHMRWFLELVTRKALPAPKIVKRHMSCDIVNLLRQFPKPTKRLDGWFTDDNGRPMDGFSAWHKLQQARLEGKTGLPSRGCDNFDPVTGECRGHGG